MEAGFNAMLLCMAGALQYAPCSLLAYQCLHKHYALHGFELSLAYSDVCIHSYLASSHELFKIRHIGGKLYVR